MKSSLKHTLKVDLAKDDEAPETSVLKLETELAGIGGGASFLKNTLDFMYRQELSPYCTTVHHESGEKIER